MEQDAELFGSWLRGDRQAGAALVERYHAAIERFFINKAGARADDLVQQTFLACLEAGANFRGEGSFRGFLFGIAKNVMFDHIRRQSKTGRESPDFATSAIIDLVPGASTLVARESEQRQLVLALQRIPLELQLVLELYYWEELSIDELAQTFEVPPGTIKSRLFRARTLLREAMESVRGGDEDERSARSMLGAWLADMRQKSDEM